MANTHELLSRGNWTGTGLRELVETALGPHVARSGAAIVVNGPDIKLTPAAASTLGMIFYELATNAVKYGGLSDQSGHVDISWLTEKVHEGERLVLKWTEIGGPSPGKEASEGFGTAFVKRSVEYELSGSVDLRLEPGGLTCTVSMPLKGNIQSATAT
ncbi:MAG TPA: HWE histidine kinase domain-containing protein [Reyranella sp.]|jgi:two-component system CheB/CheR fusion protein|nr:HWE histidine kinase domain-containing protein [Reyranella sp.]